MACNRLTKVVDDQTSPSFLLHIITFSGMEMKEINGVFEFTEGVFLAPPEVVEFLDHNWREFITVQICGEVFKNAIGNFNA